jgi:hypothetical protein
MHFQYHIRQKDMKTRYKPLPFAIELFVMIP